MSDKAGEEESLRDTLSRVWDFLTFQESKKVKAQQEADAARKRAAAGGKFKPDTRDVPIGKGLAGNAGRALSGRGRQIDKAVEDALQ